MPILDQIRMDISRLINRLRQLDAEDFNLDMMASKNCTKIVMICAICTDKIAPEHNYMSLGCGHFFCVKCLQKSSKKNGCPICRDPSELKFTIRFRFNNDENTVCRSCLMVFNGTVDIFANRCGCIFCVTCHNRLYDICTCGKEMRTKNNYAIKLFPSFD